MSRTATAAAVTESKSEAPRAVLLASLDFPSGFVRVNSSDRAIPFQSNTYKGVGNLGAVSPIGETGELQASGLDLSLTGIDPDNINAAFENAQGRAGKVYLAFLDANYVLVVDPVLMFSGRIDSVTVELGEVGTVRVALENRLVAWERPKVRRYTNEDQQQRFSGDLFLEFVAQTVDKELLWGVGSLDQVPRAPGSGAVVTNTSTIGTVGSVTIPGSPGGEGAQTITGTFIQGSPGGEGPVIFNPETGPQR